MSNKENLLKIALELFAFRGYNAVGVQDIVDAAGITKPTLYYYFGNKQGLLEAVIKKHYDLLLENLSGATNYNGDFILSVNNTIKTSLLFANQHPVFFRLYLSLTYSPADSEAFKSIESYNKSLKDMVTKLFVEAVPSHGNLRGHEGLLSMSFIGLINHYGFAIINKEIEFSEQFVHQASQHFMHGVYSL